MDNYLGYDHKEVQRLYEDHIRKAQAGRAEQRWLLQCLAQATTWLGEQLIAWSERLQARQPLTLRDSQQR